VSGAPAGAPDSDGMWAATAALPEQVAAGARVAAEVTAGARLPDPGSLRSVLALGMGGSGIGNEVLAAVAGPRCPLPVLVGKDYELPAFVGPSTLVFACSFSGNTEETLSAVHAAVAAGAPVVAVTGGGQLAELVSGCGGTVIGVPRAIPHPRAAIGAMTAAPVVVLGRLGLLEGADGLIASAVEQLSRRRDEIETAGEGGLPARLAQQLSRTIPLVYGGGPLGRAAALRWKCQVNENPKSPAFSAAQPELCHNEVTGWGQLGDITRQLITVVNLRHDFEHPRVGQRFGLVDELIDEVVAAVIEVHAAGQGPLAQLFDLVLVGDYTALHLAAREGLDPGPIPILVELKEALAALPTGA